MGYASHKIGYDGYSESNDILVEDATEYVIYNSNYIERIVGWILTDVSLDSMVRFKIDLKHTVAGNQVDFQLWIGGKMVWWKQHIGTSYTTYTADKKVTWVRGDKISVRMRAILAWGHMQNFQICGKISPMRLD